MALQLLKTFNRSMLALIAVGIAIAGSSLYYTFSLIRQPTTESVITVPVVAEIYQTGIVLPLV